MEQPSSCPGCDAVRLNHWQVRKDPVVMSRSARVDRLARSMGLTWSHASCLVASTICTVPGTRYWDGNSTATTVRVGPVAFHVRNARSPAPRPPHVKGPLNSEVCETKSTSASRGASYRSGLSFTCNLNVTGRPRGHSTRWRRPSTRVSPALRLDANTRPTFGREPSNPGANLTSYGALAACQRLLACQP
jgi:hypothetical protein